MSLPDVVSSILNPVGAAAATGLSLYSRGEALKQLLASQQPGYQPGTVRPDQNIDFSNMGSYYTDNPGSDEQARRQADFHTAAERIPFLTEQFEQDAAMKAKYLPQFEENQRAYKSGALATANQKLSDIINSGGEAISQDTMNAMVSQFTSRNNAASASAVREADAAAAQRGLTGGAAAALRERAYAANRAQNATDYRDLAIRRALANADYLANALSLGGTVGAAYASGLDDMTQNAANFDLITNPDFELISGLLSAQQQMYDQQAQNAILGFSGQFQGVGQGFWDAWQSDRQFKQQLAIAEASKPSFFESLAGPAGAVGGKVAAGLMSG